MDPDMRLGEWVQRLLPLIGEQVTVLNMPFGDESGGGGDVDCAVEGLDKSWPLRLPKGWRLCQCLHYDVKSWFWVLEHDGEVLAFDTTDDPGGLGRYGVPTSMARDGTASPSEGVRAAYLAIKRLRKGSSDERAWRRIGELAAGDAETFERVLEGSLGRRAARRFSRTVLSNETLDAEARAAGLRALRLRWLRDPVRGILTGILKIGRIADRVRFPTGLTVLVAGPDGTGKSTLADALPEASRGLFRRHAHFHWSPGLLPRPGALARRPMSDPSVPHERAPHGRLLSLVLLGYHWLDFLLGGWLLLAHLRIRSGLIVVERGWWDIAVDPRRYRLRVPQALVRALGRLLPQPDMALVLEGPADTILERKAEIGVTEIERQMTVWRTILPDKVARRVIDVAEPADSVAWQAREMIINQLEARAISRLGPGWIGIPRRLQPRWWLPRGPVRSTGASLAVHQPMTRRARAGWKVTRLLATSGAFRLWPRSQAPPHPAREMLAPFLPGGTSIAVARSNHPGRFLALIIDEQGKRVAFAKVATRAEDHVRLKQEAVQLTRLAPLLPPPLTAPRILSEGEGVLIFEAVHWLPRRAPWKLPEEVAHALGRFHRTALSSLGLSVAHGDCAPWNLLRTKEGWTLTDWEHARSDAPAWFDLFHYLVQASVLLGRPTPNELVEGLSLKGWVGPTILAYSEGAEIDPADSLESLKDYLATSAASLDPSDHRHEAAIEARSALAAILGG